MTNRNEPKQQESAIDIMAIQEENQKTFKDVKTPPQLKPIKNMFQKAKDEGTEVLIENSELSYAHSVVIKIAYVGSRWCLGYQKIYRYGEEIKVPHTIQYTDVYTQYEGSRGQSKRQPKIIFKGMNPFG